MLVFTCGQKNNYRNIEKRRFQYTDVTKKTGGKVI